MMSIKLNLEAVLGLNRKGTNKGAFLFLRGNENGQNYIYYEKQRR